MTLSGFIIFIFRQQLSKLESDIVSALEKIALRERTYNSKFENEIQHYRSAQNSLVETEQRYKEVIKQVRSSEFWVN